MLLFELLETFELGFERAQAISNQPQYDE